MSDTDDIWRRIKALESMNTARAQYQQETYQHLEAQTETLNRAEKAWRDVTASMDAADKRMQYLQDAIDKRTHWLDAAKERIGALEKQVADLAERLDKSAAAHADEFSRLEKRIQAAEVRILGVWRGHEAHHPR